MDKKTQMVLGAALLVVAGYMVYKKMQDKKKKEAAAPAAPAAPAPSAEFAGTDMNTVVGDRKQMVGLNAANAMVQDSGWVRGADGSIAPNFFDVQSSGWVRPSL